jgi:hypothetical protein
MYVWLAIVGHKSPNTPPGDWYVLVVCICPVQLRRETGRSPLADARSADDVRSCNKRHEAQWTELALAQRACCAQGVHTHTSAFAVASALEAASASAAALAAAVAAAVALAWACREGQTHHSMSNISVVTPCMIRDHILGASVRMYYIFSEDSSVCAHGTGMREWQAASQQRDAHVPGRMQRRVCAAPTIVLMCDAPVVHPG